MIEEQIAALVEIAEGLISHDDPDTDPADRGAPELPSLDAMQHWIALARKALGRP